jgi:hypothetical protein
MDAPTNVIKSLEFFKDWSNYLLVTTVAALGWVATKDRLTSLSPRAVRFVICALAFSVVCAMFTLALVPLVAEKITTTMAEKMTTTPPSIYEVTPSFRLLWHWGPEISMGLKTVCWPQHISFIVAIIVYAIAAAKATRRQR